VTESPGDEPRDVPPFGDLMNEIPLFRELQRVLFSSTGPVNWELARQVAIATASYGQDDPSPGPEDGQGLAETVRAAELAVAEFTGLPSPSDLANVRAVRRSEWVAANVKDLAEVLDPVAGKLASAIGEQGGMLPGLPGLSDLGLPAEEGAGRPDMMQLIVKQMAPLLMGVQIGSVLGVLAQGVLGQFDLPVPRPGGALLFVMPNISALERDWSLKPVDFRLWVVLHEVTHRFEFARSWVRPHFVGLVTDLVEHAELDLAGMQQRFEGLDLSDPGAMSQAVEGMGNLFGQTSDPEQRLRIARVQSFLAAAEGYGDHVSTAVGRRMLSTSGAIEEALRRHREAGHTDKALERLLGIELTPTQRGLGEEFCERVVRDTDEFTLARMWESAEALPSMPELEEPTLWLARTV